MRVSVIGLGKLGSPLAAVLASKGHEVIGVDVNPDFVRLLAAGKAPVYAYLFTWPSPLMGGALVSQGMSPSQLFQVSSIAPLLACASLLIFAKLASSRSKGGSVTVDATS